MIHVPNAAAQVYELRMGDEVHTFVFGESKHLWSFGPWTTDAELLYTRTVNDELAQLIIVGAGAVEWQEHALLQSSEKLSYLEWRKQNAALHETLHAEPSSISTTPFLDDLLAGQTSISSATRGNGENSNSYAEKR